MDAGHSDKVLGFLHIKDCVPGKLSKYEEWRVWKADVTDFLEAKTPGMAVLLKSAAAYTSELNQEGPPGQ